MGVGKQLELWVVDRSSCCGLRLRSRACTCTGRRIIESLLILHGHGEDFVFCVVAMPSALIHGHFEHGHPLLLGDAIHIQPIDAVFLLDFLLVVLPNLSFLDPPLVALVVLEIGDLGEWETIPDNGEYLTAGIFLVFLQEGQQLVEGHQLRHLAEGAVEVVPGPPDDAHAEPVVVAVAQIGLHLGVARQRRNGLDLEALAHLVQGL